MKSYIIYKTTNKINKKEYIGFHTVYDGNYDDGYMGSGKLIKAALQKYGLENFEREILFEYNSRDDAEKKERELVNETYVLRPDTYNISLGGNVNIMVGKNNPFYGKKHSKESIKKLQETRTKTIKERGYTRITKFRCIIDNKEFFSKEQTRDYLGVKSLRKILKIMFLEDRGYFIDPSFNNKMKEYLNSILEEEECISLYKSMAASIRFSGFKYSEERNKKISNSLKGRKHHWQDKVNKNPEKIRKTAEKHKGMKRTESTRRNISNAKKQHYDNGGVNPIKGKICCSNPETFEILFVDSVEDIPNGWVEGNIKTKRSCYYNPETFEVKRFYASDVIPNGWMKGNPLNGGLKFYKNKHTNEIKRKRKADLTIWELCDKDGNTIDNKE